MNSEIQFRKNYKPDYTGMTLTELSFCKMKDYKGEQQTYKLDLISQAMKTGRLKPVVFFIHGGGFIQPCDKRQAYISMFARTLTNAGYAVVSPDYPVFDDKDQLTDAGGETAGYAKAGEAIHYAYQFIKKYAVKFGLDSERIAIIGSSAGGWAAFYAIAGYADVYRAFINLWGSPERIPELVNFPPVLSVHGNADEFVAYEREFPIQEMLSGYEIEHQLITLNDSGHTPLDRIEEYMPQVMEWLHRHIKADTE